MRSLFVHRLPRTTVFLCRSASHAVLLVLLLVLPCASLAALIDRVAGSVGYEVITESELNQAMGFNSTLGGGNGENLRSETLAGLINRRLLLQEARRLKFVEVSDQEASGELEKVRERFATEQEFTGFLDRLDMTREQLSRMLRERLLVERFVEKKIGLFIRISRDEAEEYFNLHQDRFAGKTFPEVQKIITAGLQEQKLEQQLDGYLAELKNRVDIRVNP